ncbi:NAD-dependent epimerase/dehydratase family protein [Nocardia niigatensis]
MTGAAGFIGSHPTEALLKVGSDVVGLDRRGLDDPGAGPISPMCAAFADCASEGSGG